MLQHYVKIIIVSCIKNIHKLLGAYVVCNLRVVVAIL